MYISNESISSGWVNGLICWLAVCTTTIVTSTISSSNDVAIQLNAVANATTNAVTRVTGIITDIDDLGLINATSVVDGLLTHAVVDAIAYDATATCTDANETSDAYDETSSWC